MKRALLFCTLLCLTAAACQNDAPEEATLADPASQMASNVGPGSRSSHVLAYHPGLAEVLLVGGVPHDQDSGVWGWNGTQWQQHSTDQALGSRGHMALAYDPSQDRLLLHGGLALRPGEVVGEDGRYGDLWAWKDTTWSRIHEADIGPGQRDHHAMVYDAARQEMVLFGGGRGAPGHQVLLNDTWLYDGENWRQAEGSAPPPRSTHRLVYDDHRNRVVLFGGWGEDGLLNDTWEWDGTEWTLASEDGPSPRFATRMTYDMERNRTVLFGGRGAEGDLGDTWEWDGASWTEIDVAGPPLRNVHSMAYDPSRDKVVLFGGFHQGERFEDTWLWDGTSWEQVQ